MRLLERVLEARARKCAQRASALQGVSQKEREREKERRNRKKDRQTQRPKLWWSKGVLINMAWAYILSYKVVILSKDKD